MLTFHQGREGSSDSGETIAACLGLSSIVLDRTAWRQDPFSEILFLAADAYGEEMHVVVARSYLQGRVLLTGHHGDAVWGTGDYDLTPDIVRIGPPSGLSLTEWRLWVGFIHARLHAMDTAPCAGMVAPPNVAPELEGPGAPPGLATAWWVAPS